MPLAHARYQIPSRSSQTRLAPFHERHALGVVGGLVCRRRRGLLSHHVSLFAAADTLDLKQAVVVVDKTVKGPQAQAVRMLVEEVQKRTQIAWSVADAWPEQAPAVIVVGLAPFVDATLSQHGVNGARGDAGHGGRGIPGARRAGQAGGRRGRGNDERGVLFGVGRLAPRAADGAAARRPFLPSLNVATAPEVSASRASARISAEDEFVRRLVGADVGTVHPRPGRLRHQRGRIASAADRRRVRQSAFSAAADADDGRNVADRWIDYGLDVWIWYPAMDADYSNPKTVKKALAEWANVFRQLPRVDAVFVPGGDPGHTDPNVLLPVSRTADGQPASLSSARADVGLAAELQPEMARLVLRLFEDESSPSWLSGVVYGPQIRVSLPEMRAAIPKKYPDPPLPRHHAFDSVPIPGAGLGHGVRRHRGARGDQPAAAWPSRKSFAAWQHEAIGFISYSEGCNDDVNKIVWSGLGWDPDRPVVETLREYGRYFIGDEFADDFAQGLLALERNWRGPLVANAAVMTTLQQFQGLERAATPAVSLNWRFQQALYRAYYDAFIYRRLLYETELEQQALNRLSAASKVGSPLAMTEAENDVGPGRRAAAGYRHCGPACSSWATCCFRAFACSSACRGTRRSASTAGRRSTRSTNRSTTGCGSKRGLRKSARWPTRTTGSTSCTRSSIGPIRAPADFTTTWAT